jgi:hypothetical protein
LFARLLACAPPEFVRYSPHEWYRHGHPIDLVAYPVHGWYRCPGGSGPVTDSSHESLGNCTRPDLRYHSRGGYVIR